MKRSDNYAGNQIRLFLGELKNATHVAKMKAIQHFQNYIRTYQPNVSDDNVDYLFTGSLDGVANYGLLYWCGVDSEKHDGQLKRICGPLISFLRWLVTFPEDTIYYERFTRLPKEEIVKANFPKHILKVEARGTIQISSNQSRAGNSEDAFELLCILLNDHKTIEDELDPIDVMYLLKGSIPCQEKFEEWLRKADLEHMTEALNQLKNPETGHAAIDRTVRPREWSSVNLKYIPVQEGEDVEEVEEDDTLDELPPIPDPLGLSNTDLRDTQELYASGLLQKSSMFARRNTAAMLVYDPTGSGLRSRVSRYSMADSNTADNEEDDDEDDETRYSNTFTTSTEKRVIPSVIPTEKSFSVPLFMSLVHGQTQFSELQTGLDHLKETLVQQSRRRENLVRNHFGLFVQCADGLEWLKAYRKGIYKENETSRSRAASRRSLLDDAGAVRRRTNTFVDKGMEKLAKAQTRLDEAKIEAKSTLAPILERMRMSREIRSAEKVLRGMASLLEYPHQMKKSLERGELRETIAIYKRIQLIPTSSSLKIVPKIKTAAESVINDLRKLCYNVILTPNPQYSVILQHAALLQELDGPIVYLDILRLSFLRQLSCLLELLKLCKDRFCQESIEAFHKGQEINIVTNNSILAKGETETIIATIRKFTTDIRLRRRPGVTTTRRRRTSFSDSHSPRRTSSRGSFSSESHNNPRGRAGSVGGDRSNNYFYTPDDDATELMSTHGGFGIAENQPLFEDGDDLFLPPPDFEEEFMLSPESSPNKSSNGAAARRRGSLYSEFLDRPGGSAQQQQDNLMAVTEGGGNILANQDYCELFCNIIRKIFAESIVEILSRWFPCLFRLSFEIVFQQNKATTALTPSAHAASKLVPALMTSKNVKTLSSTNRLLASALNLGAEYLQQSVSGFRSASTSSPFSSYPNELSTAMTELENVWASVEANFGMKLQLTYLLQPEDVVTNSRFHDIVVTPTFGNPIANQQLRLILDDIFIMYEAIETSMKTALNSLNPTGSNSNTISSPYLEATPSSGPPLGQLMRFDTMRFMGKATPAAIPGLSAAAGLGLGLIGGNKVNRDIVELDYNSTSSPYYEPMKSLYLLSQEGVAALAQTILDKMLDKSCQITDHLLNEPSPTHDNSNEIIDNSGLGVEFAVKEFEDLIFKGLMALKKYIKRPEWVASIVHENIFKKIVASFTEGLRRKSLFIEQGKSTSKVDQSGGPSPTTRRNRKKSNAMAMPGVAAGGRASMHQNTLILQSMEEELRNLDFGWERDCGDIKEKPTAWIDYLRGCIRFRAYSAPLILKQVSKIFSLDQSSTALFTAPAVGVGVLNRENSAGVSPIAPSGGASSGGGNSLLNRLFAFETSNDPMANTNTSNSNPSKRPSLLDPTSAKTTATDEGDSDRFDSKPRVAVETPESRLQDRMINAIKENSKLFNDYSTVGGGFLYQNLRDVIQYEVDAMQKLLAYRVYSMKTILLSAYAFMVHVEIQGNIPGSNSNVLLSLAESKTSFENQYMMSVLPSHVSKIILALAEERKILMSYFNAITLEYGGNKHDYYQTSLTRLHTLGNVNNTNNNTQTGNNNPTVAVGGSGPGIVGIAQQPSRDTASVMEGNNHDSDSDTDYFYDNESMNDAASFFQANNSPSRTNSKRPSLFGVKYNGTNSGMGQGQAYGVYVFEELCKGILDTYEEILKKLLAGQLFDIQTLKFSANPKVIPMSSASPSSNREAIPYRSLHQCYEEFEFFKGLFRPILLNTQILQRTTLSSSEMNTIMKEKSIVTKEELMKSGVALTILIQSISASTTSSSNVVLPSTNVHSSPSQAVLYK